MPRQRSKHFTGEYGSRSIHAGPDNSVRLTSEYSSRSIHAGPDKSVRLTSEYGSRSIHAGPDNSVRLASEYSSRSIHAGPDKSVRLTSEYGSRSIHAGPDNSVRLTSEYGSRSIHAGPDNSVRFLHRLRVELNKCSTTKTLKRVSLGKMVTGPGIFENPGPNIASISQVQKTKKRSQMQGVQDLPHAYSLWNCGKTSGRSV